MSFAVSPAVYVPLASTLMSSRPPGYSTRSPHSSPVKGHKG